MLQHTFCHLPGIGAAAERKLWDAGCRSWAEFMAGRPAKLAATRRQRLHDGLSESQRRIQNEDLTFFAAGLPPAEHWRLFPTVRPSILYFDIETTGLDWRYDSITTIATYDGTTIRHYVRGVNLDDFATDTRGYRAVVTFNGKCFDVPFVERTFNIRMPPIHIDLRYVLRGLGFSGGLKACERRLGLHRDDLADIDGFMAVLLWQYHQRKASPEALETLLAYNVQDAINLETLMVQAYNLKLATTPFHPELALQPGTPPPNPFKPHRAILNKLGAG